MNKFLTSLTNKDIPFGVFIAVVVAAQCVIQGIHVAILTWLILALFTVLWEFKDRKRNQQLAQEIEDLDKRIKESAANLERIKNSF